MFIRLMLVTFTMLLALSTAVADVTQPNGSAQKVYEFSIQSASGQARSLDILTSTSRHGERISAISLDGRASLDVYYWDTVRKTDDIFHGKVTNEWAAENLRPIRFYQITGATADETVLPYCGELQTAELTTFLIGFGPSEKEKWSLVWIAASVLIPNNGGGIWHVCTKSEVSWRH